MPEREKEDVRAVFAQMGLSPTLQTVIADELAKDKNQVAGSPVRLIS